MPEKEDKVHQLIDAGAIHRADWTIDTLKEHFSRVLADTERRLDERITSQEKAVTLAMTAADRAVIKAEVATEKRFESVNEFRAALADNGRTLMPRSECEARFGSSDAKSDTAIKALSNRIDVLVNAAVRGEGKEQGMSAGWGLAALVIGLVMTAISVMVIIYTKAVPH